MKYLIISVFLLTLIGCSEDKSKQMDEMTDNSGKDQIKSFSGRTETATLAGGCFWCMEAPFEGIDGIISVTSGYAGGDEENPSYKEVSSGSTGHRESVQIVFDPAVISYEEVLSIYWKQFNPTDKGGSFADRGSQYTSAIFYRKDAQKQVAEKSKERLDNSGIFDKPVVTPIIKFKNFFPAEDYHQDFYKKDPERYHSYKKASGREGFIEEVWGKIKDENYTIPSKEELKKKLTDLQYGVTQESATERAFENKYWDNKHAGIYVDIVSGEPLFTSSGKFDSGTGWPSFTRAIDPRRVHKLIDTSLGMKRIEIRSRFADSHLGHLFTDGPAPSHLRYCMNSAALNFIPKEEMEEKGYGKFLWLVE